MCVLVGGRGEQWTRSGGESEEGDVSESSNSGGRVVPAAPLPFVLDQLVVWTSSTAYGTQSVRIEARMGLVRNSSRNTQTLRCKAGKKLNIEVPNCIIPGDIGIEIESGGVGGACWRLARP